MACPVLFPPQGQDVGLSFVISLGFSILVLLGLVGCASCLYIVCLFKFLGNCHRGNVFELCIYLIKECVVLQDLVLATVAVPIS